MSAPSLASGRRVVLHRNEVARVRRELYPQAELHNSNLRLNNRMVMVRVATAAWRNHHVRVGGKRYTYLRKVCGWNLHVRSRCVPRPHTWVLVAYDGGERRVWVVPGAKLQGPTASIAIVRTAPRGAILDQYERTP